jgi:hypothetical protein
MRVTQGGEPSSDLNESRPGFFGPVHDLITPIQIIIEDGTLVEKELITERSPLLFFRLVQHDFARCVSDASRGLNFAVIPDCWRFNEEKSGPPPLESESLAISGYAVHYFSVDRNPILAFERPGKEPFEFRPAKPRFGTMVHSVACYVPTAGNIIERTLVAR